MTPQANINKQTAKGRQRAWLISFLASEPQVSETAVLPERERSKERESRQVPTALPALKQFQKCSAIDQRGEVPAALLLCRSVFTRDSLQSAGRSWIVDRWSHYRLSIVIRYSLVAHQYPLDTCCSCRQLSFIRGTYPYLVSWLVPPKWYKWNSLN